MAAGLTVTWMLVPTVQPAWPWLGAFAFFVILGAVDDRLHLSASPKFLFQAFVATLAVVGSGVSLSALGEIVPGWLPALGWLAIPFSVFAIVSVMNAVNMTDGVDGLAGSLLLVAFLILALAAGMADRLDVCALALVPCSALLAFLLFNFRGRGGRPARVFMGDAGSLGMGFLLAVLAVTVASSEHVAVPPAVVIWACFVPLADGLSVIVSRLARRAGAATPGRDHLHHLLLKHGLTPRQVVLAEAGGGLLLGLAALAGWRLGLPDWVFVGSFVGLLAGFHLTVTRSWARPASSEPLPQGQLGLEAEPEVVTERGPV